MHKRTVNFDVPFLLVHLHRTTKWTVKEAKAYVRVNMTDEVVFVVCHSYNGKHYIGLLQCSLSYCSSSRAVSFRANDTGQLSSSDVHWTRQWSTEDFNRVDHCLVSWCSAACNFRCLVPAHVVAAFSLKIACFWDQISRVFGVPAVRTLCSCWNHEDCWPTSHAADCTRRWESKQWIAKLCKWCIASTINITYSKTSFAFLWICQTENSAANCSKQGE